MGAMTELIQTACPACNKPMRLVSIVPSLWFAPALHTYQCTFCNELVTLEANQKNRLKENEDGP